MQLISAPREIRTLDLPLKRRMLYQLSYGCEEKVKINILSLVSCIMYDSGKVYNKLYC